MKLAIMVIMPLLILVNSAQAGQCYRAYKQAKKIEKMVEGVDYTTETDDHWYGFASWAPVADITEDEIRKALKLGNTYDGEESFFSMESAEKAYEFLDWEIELNTPENYDKPEQMAKLKNLKELLSNKYGSNIRLIMFGNGDGDGYFVGPHMIIMIDKQGCVLGIRAMTVWT